LPPKSRVLDRDGSKSKRSEKNLDLKENCDGTTKDPTQRKQ